MRSRAGSWSLGLVLFLCVALIATGSGPGFLALAQSDGTPVIEEPAQEEQSPTELPSETPAPALPTETSVPPTEPPAIPTQTLIPSITPPLEPTASATPTSTDIPVEPASTEDSSPTPTWANTWTTLTATLGNCRSEPNYWIYKLVMDGPESVVSGLNPSATLVFRSGGTTSIGTHPNWSSVRESPTTPGDLESTLFYVHFSGVSSPVAMATVSVPDITRSTFELTSAPTCGSFPTPTPTSTYTPTRTTGGAVQVNADLSSCRQGYHWTFKTVIDYEPQYLPGWLFVTFASGSMQYVYSTSAIWDGTNWTNLFNYYGNLNDTIVSAYGQIPGGVNGTITLVQGPTCAPWPPPGSTETPTPTQTTTPSPSPEPLVTQATFAGCASVQNSWAVRYETSGAYPSAPTLTFTDGSYSVASIEWHSDLGNGVLETNATLKSNLGGQLVSVTLPERAGVQITNFRVVGGPNCTPGTLTSPVWTPTVTHTPAPIPALTDLPLDFSACRTGPGFHLKLIVSQRPTMDSMNLVFANGSTGWASPVTLASLNTSTGRWEVTYGSSSGTGNDRLAYASMVLASDAQPEVQVLYAPQWCELGSIAGYPTRTATTTRTPTPTPTETFTPTITNTPTNTHTATATQTVTTTPTITLSPTPTSETVDVPMSFSGCYPEAPGWFLQMSLPVDRFPDAITITFVSGATASMRPGSSSWWDGAFQRTYILNGYTDEQAYSLTAELPYGVRGSASFYAAANCVSGAPVTPTSTPTASETPTETGTPTSTATETETPSPTVTPGNTPAFTGYSATFANCRLANWGWFFQLSFPGSIAQLPATIEVTFSSGAVVSPTRTDTYVEFGRANAWYPIVGYELDHVVSAIALAPTGDQVIFEVVWGADCSQGGAGQATTTVTPTRTITTTPTITLTPSMTSTPVMNYIQATTWACETDTPYWYFQLNIRGSLSNLPSTILLTFASGTTTTIEGFDKSSESGNAYIWFLTEDYLDEQLVSAVAVVPQWITGELFLLRAPDCTPGSPVQTPTATPSLFATEIATVAPTETVTDTPTLVPTATDTPTASATATETASNTPSAAPSETATVLPPPTETATNQPTETATASSTSTVVPTDTATETSTATASATATVTATPSSTPTQIPSSTSTQSPVPTDVPTESATPSSTPTEEPTQTSTPTSTETATATATATFTPTRTVTPSSTATTVPTETATASNTPSSTPTETATATNTPTSTSTETASSTSTATSSPSETPTATPSATSTPTETATPSNTATASSTATATVTSSSTPSSTSTSTPSSTSTATATSTALPTMLTTANVNCRTGASSSATSLGVVPRNTALPVRGTASGGWIPVVCFGQNGWISSSYLTPVPTPTATLPSGAVVTTTARVNCRTGATTGSSILGVVPTRTTLALRGAVQGGWYPVVCFGQNGWISASYLTPAPTATATVPSGPRAVTTTRVNCRTSPTTSQANVVTVLNSGVTVPVRGTASGGWTPVTCANQPGWISSQYLRSS